MTQLTVLRCWRCRHHYRDHRSDGCCVSKSGARCECKKYVGDYPAPKPADKDTCPHEFQEDVNAILCVHCNRTVNRSS